MHPSLTSTYLLPAIFLNPVLFLHSANTILSRILPPIVAASSVQPLPYSSLGPSGSHPHIDMHASDNLCWSYTAIMVCAQLVAFGSVSQSREESKVRKEMKREREREERRTARMQDEREGNGELLENGDIRHANGNGCYVTDKKLQELTRDDSEGTEDEIIL